MLYIYFYFVKKTLGLFFLGLKKILGDLKDFFMVNVNRLKIVCFLI
jgi:hypothetical protein